MVVTKEDFLTATPTEEQLTYINNPKKLIREYVYPYKKIFDTKIEATNILTVELANFEKKGDSYINGFATFYICIPVAYEPTLYGSRLDYIGDQIESCFTNSNIGDFNFDKRSDFTLGQGYTGQWISFEVVDFHIRDDS